MKGKEQVLSAEKLQGMLGLKGVLGRWITRLVMKILEIDKVNTTQAKFAQDNAPDFSKHVLEDIGIQYELPEEDLELPSELQPLRL